MTVALVIAVLAAGVLIAAALNWRTRQRGSAFVHGRDSMSDREFAGLFASSKEAAVGVSIRELLQPWVPVDVRLVRPEDRLCKDLQLDARDGLDPEEFLRTVEKRWGVSVPRSEAVDALTIAQLASLVARLLGPAQSNMSFDADAQTRPRVPRSGCLGAGQRRR